MKNLKLAAPFLCIVLLVTTLMTGCGQAKQDEQKSAESTAQTQEQTKEVKKEPVTITFWKAPNSGNEEEAITPLLDKFRNENQDIKVDYLLTPWDSWKEKYTAAFASGTPPDVSYMTEWYPMFSEAGKLADITEKVIDNIKSRYPDNLWDYATYDGKIIGIPFVDVTTVMFYNKDMFAKESIAIPQTWDELRDACRKLTKDTDGDKKVDQWGIFFGQDIFHQYIYYPIQAGGDFLSPDKKELGFANADGLKGIQYLYDLIYVDKVSPSIEEMDNNQMYDLFYKGKIGMVHEPIGSAAKIKAESKFQLGAFLMPAGPSSDPIRARSNYGGIGLLSIAEESKHKDAAWTLIDFMSTPDNEAIYNKAANIMSPNPELTKKLYPDDELMSVASDAIQYMKFYPLETKWQEVDTLLKNMFQEIATGKKKPEQALNDANEKAKEVLK